MVEALTGIDKNLFIFINSHFNDTFDFLMYWISNRLIWIPFYIVLALLLIKEYNKQFFFMIFFVGILIAISDQVSVLIKNYAERPRPCHDPALEYVVHVVRNHCGGKFGFISSHASNAMSLVTFLFLACDDRMKWLKFIMIPWVIIVSYSRIYLGVHYPFDIMGGWFLGIILGVLVYYFYMLVAQSRQGPIKFH